MKRLVPIAALLLLLQACDATPVRTTAMTPIVRLAAVPGRPAAGYFELDIHDDRGALLSVTSPQAGRIEMHETMNAGNMTSMHPLERVPVRNGDRLIFSPGGRHLMIYDVDPSVRPGGQITLVLHFERGPPQTLGFVVTAANGDTQ